MKTKTLLSALLFISVVSCTRSNFHQAQDYVRQRKYHLAIEEFLSFAHNKPSSKRAPEALLEVAHLYEVMLDKPKLALKVYRRMVKDYPKNSYTLKAQRSIAKLLKDQFGEYRAAMYEYEKLSHTVPEDASLEIAIAECYTLMHQHEKANQQYLHVLKEHPSYAKRDAMYFAMASNLFIQGKYEEAINRYQNIIEEFPKSEFAPQALFGIGNTYEELDQFSEAISYYQKAMKTYPSPEAVKIRLQGVQKRAQRKGFLFSG